MPRKRRRRRSKKRHTNGAFTDQDVQNVIGKYEQEYGTVKVIGGDNKSTTSTTGTTGGWYRRACNHWREKVTLYGGIEISCSAWFDRPDKQVDIDTPDIGVYFDSSWASIDTMVSKGWRGPTTGYKGQLCILGWPDWSTPTNFRQTLKVLEYALNRAGEGDYVDIGCLGAHGRTGTALAAMQCMLGVEPDEAMQWVWNKYCWHAIESKSQEHWIERVYRHFHGEPKGYDILDLREDKKTGILLPTNESAYGITRDPSEPTVEPAGQRILDDMVSNGEITPEQWCEWTGLPMDMLPDGAAFQAELDELIGTDKSTVFAEREQWEADMRARWSKWCEICDSHSDYCYCHYGY